MSDTYAAVDASSAVGEAIEWQERIDHWPAIDRYKAAMDRIVGDASPVIDIGAGPGLDAARTGAIAVDSSRAMAARAQSREVTVAVGDAHRLPFADGAAGAVRADRVLQHLAEPDAALAEMVRVLRPGGRLVVADPDQGTLSISVPGVPDRLTESVRRLRRDVGYRNGRLAPQIAGRLAALGMADVRVEASVLVLTDPELAFGLPGWVDYWRDAAGFSDADDEAWRAALASSVDDGFVFAVTYLVTSAVKG
ncbi:MAG: methyltransferase domain-containing protein [Ilumatobacteraceae bacterium]